MPRIQHSIHIDRQPATVFAVTNDIDRWSQLFDAYLRSEVVKREDAGRFIKLTFRLKNNEGLQWQSWRLLDQEELVAIAEREEPLYPFSYMHLRWTYQPDGDGTYMTWIQDFELDPTFALSEAEMTARMEQHGRNNQSRIKQILESGQLSGGDGR